MIRDDTPALIQRTNQYSMPRRSSAATRFAILSGGIAALLAVGGHTTDAATYSWGLNGTANWDTNNWGAAAAPLFPNAVGDVAQFTTGAFNPTANLNLNVTVGQLKSNVSAQTWTIGATGGVLTFDNTGGVNNVFGNANAAISATGAAADANVIQINAPIVISNTNLDIGTTNGGMTIGAGGIAATTSQTLTFRNNGTAGNRNILVTGPIGTNGAGTLAIQNLGTLAGDIASGNNPAGVVLSGVIGNKVTGISQSSPGALVLSNAGNTFAGNISVTAGMLSVTNDGALGNATNGITLDGGTLANFNVAGTNSGFADPGFAPINLGAGRTITLGVGGGTFRVGFARTLAIGGVIAGSGNLTKIDTANLVLGGLNTYSGVTSVNAGTVTVSNIGNAGNAGNLGTNSTINLGSLGTNGTLNYTGPGETTDRVINWAGTTGGGNINANGTGLIRFTSNTTTTGSGAKGLVFSGAGVGQLDGAIVNNGGLLNLNKNSTGTWTLNGNLTLGAGAINVNSGTLNLGGANVTTGNYVVGSTARLVLAGSSTNTSLITVNGGGIVGGSGSTTGLLSAAANAAIQLNTATPSAAITSNGVTFNGATTISFDSAPASGTYTVLNYGAGAVTNLTNLVGARGGFTDNLAGQITANVSVANRTWSGTTGTWDSGTSTSWVEGDNKFFAGDTVTFSDPAAANTVTVSGPVAPAAIAVNNTTASYTFSGTGAIVGTAGLTKTGNGTLTISNANNYFGGTTINGGTVMIGNANALGTGPVTLAGGATLGVNGALTIANPVAVTGSGTINSSSAGNASATIVTLSGVISGNANLTVAANGDTSDTGGGVGGDTILSGANTFTGNVTITSGVVDITSGFGNAANTIILNGGGLVDRNINVNLARNIQVGASGGVLRSFGSATTTFSGAISNAPGVAAATLKHTDGGTQRLAGDGSGFVGTFTNARGALEITANNANWQNTDFVQDPAGLAAHTLTLNGGGTASLKSIAMSKDVIVNNGTRLNVSAVNWTANSWIKTTAGTAGTLTSSTGTLTVNSSIATDQQIQLRIQDFDASTPVALVKNGASEVKLTTTNTYTGGTTVNAGVLNLTGGGGANGTIRGTVTVNSGATLRLSTGDATGYDATTRLSTINLIGGTLNVNTASNQTLGNAVINMTGASITGIANSNIDFFRGSSALNSLASATTSTISGVTLAPIRQGDTTFNVQDGTALIDLQIDSLIKTSTNPDAINGKLTKAGTGALAVTANNTLSNKFEVAAGLLLVNNTPALTTDSGTGSAAVEVLSGAIIGGTGSIAPSGANGVSVAGVLAPGTGIGNLTVNLGATTGTVSLTGGSFKFELGASGADINSFGTSDVLTIAGASAGDVAFSGNIVDFSGTGASGWYKVFDTSLDATTWTGLTIGAGNVITNGLMITNLATGLTGQFVIGDGITGSSGDIYLNVVPEPGVALALTGGSALLLGLRRRRRASI